MQLLEDRIRRDGKVAPGNVLRVDSFINHQMDIALMEQLAQEFRRRFSGVRVDKVLTVEASGIAIATLVAQAFGVQLKDHACFLPHVVSRKKQIVPMLSALWG